MPVNSIGPWTLGPDLTKCTIASATVAGSVWTVGAAVELKGVIRRLNHQVRYGLKDIRPITNQQENMVIVSTGNALQLTVLRVNNNTTPGNPLSAMLAGGYCQAIFDDAHEEYNGYFVVASYESGFDGNEEQVQTLDLQPVALVGQSQVVRSFV